MMDMQLAPHFTMRHSDPEALGRISHRMMTSTTRVDEALCTGVDLMIVADTASCLVVSRFLLPIRTKIPTSGNDSTPCLASLSLLALVWVLMAARCVTS